MQFRQTFDTTELIIMTAARTDPYLGQQVVELLEGDFMNPINRDSPTHQVSFSLIVRVNICL